MPGLKLIRFDRNGAQKGNVVWEIFFLTENLHRIPGLAALV